jgi:methylated-DNA-[protein]-cysteine S-methyltransferase
MAEGIALKTMEANCLSFSLLESPVGWIGVVANGESLLEVHLHPDKGKVRHHFEAAWPTASSGDDGLTGVAMGQLEEYFLGQREEFHLPLDFSHLPPFFAKILDTLRRVPFGKTITYGELARQSGHPRAARAVGRAMAVNPFPIIVPCHRVVGAGGRLTGYSGGKGIDTKKWLLEFEGGRAEIFL